MKYTLLLKYLLTVCKLLLSGSLSFQTMPYTPVVVHQLANQESVPSISMLSGCNFKIAAFDYLKMFKFALGTLLLPSDPLILTFCVCDQIHYAC